MAVVKPYALAGLVIALGLAGAFGVIHLAYGQTDIQYLTESHQFLWDPVTTDLEGNPEVIATYELAMLQVGVDLNTSGTAALRTLITGSAGSQGTPTGALFRGFKPGPYRFQVRAQDVAGNWGPWSAPLDLVLDHLPPSAPRTLRVKVSVTVVAPAGGGQ